MKVLSSVGFIALAVASWSQSSLLTVDPGATRTRTTVIAAADAKVRGYAQSLARATSVARTNLKRAGLFQTAPFSVPSVVRLNGAQPFGGSNILGGGITLQFDTSGSGQFPSTYQQLLQDTFNQAQSTLNGIFGGPSFSGAVRVVNFDATIGDRDAVAGGYFLPDNGSGQKEIRFPIYSNDEAAAVNFVHCLLLAYLGANSYGFDAFQEGLVRAATMRVVRTAGAMPVALDPSQIEAVLDNTYDVGTFYDWFNQRALGGRRFIAPNLRDVPLPPGGSLGGVYLARFQMAGSAWQKLLAEYPGFISQFNTFFHLNPSIGGNAAALITLGQQTMDFLSGGPNATIEGKSFSEWYRRQFILETNDTRGLKLLLQPIPLPPESGSSDFGVFLFQATFFETLANGDEVLLSGTSYPIYWADDFNRFFPSAQDDVMPISGAYGSVAPNLIDLYAGSPYRATFDLPIQDRIARAYVPAGAIATGQTSATSDFYGTIVGLDTPVGSTDRIRLTYGLTILDNIPISRGAFGVQVNTPGYLGYARCRVEIVRTTGTNESVVLDRRVNKGPGPLALDLRANNGETTFSPSGGLPKGLSTLGSWVDPFASLPSALFGIPELQVLLARWNGVRGRFEIYPDCGSVASGLGFFNRLDAALPGFGIAGRYHPGVPVSVSLRPGWNLIACPLSLPTPTTQVQVIKTTDLPVTFADARGTLLGLDFFAFTPGPNDAATGAPETGTLVAATTFEPGKAYFVRVLNAEGVTLVFRPGGSQLMASGGPPASPGTPPINFWNIALKISQGQFSAVSHIGQNRFSDQFFNPMQDSALSPSPGGLQVVNEGPASYRDNRWFGNPETYRFKVVGLRPGTQYKLSGDLTGRLKRFEFYDLTGGAVRQLVGSFTHTFTASGVERQFQVRVRTNSW